MRLAFTSDLHTDSHSANRCVWQEMVAMLHDIQPDIFICCGDIAADAQQLGISLFALESLPCPKLLVPGNHDIWVRNKNWLKKGVTSRHKHDNLLPALCHAAGFHPLWIEPFLFGNIAFCGSMGWYDYSLRNHAFDAHFSLQDYRRKGFQSYQWNDRRFVHWHRPGENGTSPTQIRDEVLAADLANKLTQQLQYAQQHASRIIAVTHMLPFRAMMVYHQEPQRDYFGAFMGSVLLGEAIQSCPQVELVLSGHTHRKQTVQVGHITAHTSPLGYARQWQNQTPRDIARERLSIIEIG
ncbi:MAG: metallophosphoesterase [bacterium]|nr:metallophosphoesterase [bacterium]